MIRMRFEIIFLQIINIFIFTFLSLNGCLRKYNINIKKNLDIMINYILYLMIYIYISIFGVKILFLYVNNLSNFLIILIFIISKN